jgi:hypothetical protein
MFMNMYMETNKATDAEMYPARTETLNLDNSMDITMDTDTDKDMDTHMDIVTDIDMVKDIGYW